MFKEGEPAIAALFASELLESAPTTPAESISATVLEESPREHEISIPAADSSSTEREDPKPTIREVRAVRSLLYNRLLLERVLLRIERAEAIILSYLLAQDDSNAQIGPYQVELDKADHLSVTQTEEDGWQQLRISEFDYSTEEILTGVRNGPISHQLRM